MQLGSILQKNQKSYRLKFKYFKHFSLTKKLFLKKLKTFEIPIAKLCLNIYNNTIGSDILSNFLV